MPPKLISKKLPRMPIGISDFRQIMTQKGLYGQSFWFADKTGLIPDLIEGSLISLITRPRRFGKTLNLSMLRYFFDVREAAENRALFDGLAIARNQAAMAYQGQYPVIFLSLKNIDQNDFPTTLNAFRMTLSRLYGQHRYLLGGDGSVLNPNEQAFFKKILWEDVTQEQLESSLEQLILFLNRYHNRKVVVLVDEYDSPLLSAFYGKFHAEFRQFYRNFFGAALKDNPYIYKAVLTGIAQIAGADLFSKFNNSDSYNVLDERYANYFGFTQQNIHELLQAMDRLDRYNEINEWYNGYLFGGDHVLYTPWSVLKYLDRECIPQAYWAYTSDNRLLRQNLLEADGVIKSDFVQFMADDGYIEKEIKNTMQFDDVEAGAEESLWTLLLSTGYLKAEVLERKASSVIARIRIPNREIWCVYTEIFKSWLRQKMGSRSYGILFDHLRHGRIKEFCDGIVDFFSTTVSQFDVRKDYIEAFYHGFLLGLLGLMMPTHWGHLRSNRESGEGRYDILFEPTDVQKGTGIVIELKRIGSAARRGQALKKQLAEASQVGLDQIHEREYAQELEARGIKNIALISFAFHRKQLAYCYESALVVSRKRAAGMPDTNVVGTPLAFFKKPRQRMALSVKDRHWYTDDEMNTLLDRTIGRHPGVDVMDGINLDQRDGRTLGENLADREKQLERIETQVGLATPTLVLPINLGNRHWVALYIYHQGQDRTCPMIGYFDPFGNPMPRTLHRLLTRRYPGSDMANCLVSPIKLQKEGYNCGPWVVEILRELVAHGRLPAEDFDIDATRAEHQQLLHLEVANLSTR